MSAKKPIIIAIDGPAASGKGTLARRVADHYGLDYLDTGRLYRVVGQTLLTQVNDVLDAEDHSSPAAQAAIDIACGLNANHVMNASNLSSEQVGRAASIVSAIPAVRAALLAFQQDFSRSPRGAVLDGRDVGTVVCPDANVKFFITADIEVRAERRFKQLQSTDASVTKSAVLQDLEARDRRDKERQSAPLKPANDALHIDTSSLAIDDVFAAMTSAIDPLLYK